MSRGIRAIAMLLLMAPGVRAGSTELRPGVIFDKTRGVAYLGGAAGGIEAVDLASGRLLWQSADAAIPLALRDRFLAARVDEPNRRTRLRIAVLDVAAGVRTVAEGITELPADVRALVSDELGRSFRVTATADAEGFLVTWTWRATVIEGVARDPGTEPAEQTALGTMRVRVPSRGTAMTLAVDAACAGVAERLTVPHAPWRAGDVLAVAVGGRGGPMTLKRWACSGEALADKTLSEKALTALPSADRTHLLVGERAGKGGEADSEYRWSIVSLETGETIGEVRRNVSAAPFFIWKDTMVFVSQPRGFRRGDAWIEEPLEVVAIRLTTGASLWRRAIRDLEYRGPAPPAQ